jgi:hypothetical protein
VDVQAQQVDQAVTGRLEDGDLDREQAEAGEEVGPPGEADLPLDHRSGDHIRGEGDDAEGPQRLHEQEGAEAAGAARRPRVGRAGGEVHAAPS